MGSTNEILLSNYAASDFLIEKTDLHFKIYSDYVEVLSKLTLSVQDNSVSKAHHLHLNGQELELQQVILDNVSLTKEDYIITDKHLIIKNTPKQFTLEITVHIHPHKVSQLIGLYLSDGQYVTHCEPEGFQRITYYLDRPDVMSIFTVTIEADKKTCPTLLSNGELIDAQDLPNNRHQAIWHDPFKKPCYLFALIAGNFHYLADSHQTKEGKNIQLKVFVAPEVPLEHVRIAMQALKSAIIWDEKTYNLCCDIKNYNIVAVNDFNIGAMENKGLNIFNSSFIIGNPDIATDLDIINIKRLIAHEYFHNWTGNRITCRDWFQLALKEGLTVFREHCYEESLQEPGIARIDKSDLIKKVQFLEDASALAHPVIFERYEDICNFFDTTVYQKGAELYRMILTIVGEENFYKVFNRYIQQYDGHAVTLDNFVALFEGIGSFDKEKFELWYHQAGTPELFVSEKYHAEKQQYVITIKQRCIDGATHQLLLPMLIPVSVSLLGVNQKKVSTQDAEVITHKKTGNHLLLLSQEEQSFQFDHVDKKPTLSLLRDFSAPVNIHFDYTNDMLCQLIQEDDDPFAKWNATQLLMTKKVITVMNSPETKPAEVIEDALIEAFSVILKKLDNKALLSRMLTLPSVEEIALGLSEFDPENLFSARELVRHELSLKLKPLLSDIYTKYSRNEKKYYYTPEAIGIRSLKNTCLNYLMLADEKNYISACIKQYYNAVNMTDIYAALAAINNSATSKRTEILADFQAKWQDDPILRRKWLILEASSLLPNTLERVKEIAYSNQFDIKNPNSVYDLIGTFGHNHKHFHQSNGSGYQFYTDQIIRLCEINIEVASQLLKRFSFIEKLTSKKQAMIKKQLERIAEVPNIAVRIKELVSKLLHIK